MWRWLHRKADSSPAPPVSRAQADQALVDAERRLAEAQRMQSRRDPVWTDAERHIARNGIYDDLVASLRLKGSSS
jgi:hypothetical protein